MSGFGYGLRKGATIMTPWDNQILGKYPLRLNSKVRVMFRDGTTSRQDATVGDFHGLGDDSSNWVSAGEPEDIIAYEEIAA
ncbi:hypothetical protein EVB53_097 [Rhizobium phage RHph_Y60]|nr:hypothetical protein EVB53_097 [Rhizobium phage RHph_Y60]